jgi:anti-sigma-K factor RskA
VRLQRRHELHTLTGSYAMDALEGAELQQFERHLRRCQSCAAEVRGLRETAARLAMAAAERPPDGFRERVLGEATLTRQLPPLTEEHPGRRPGRLPGRPWVPRLSIAVAAVSLAVAVALGITQAMTQHKLDTAQARDRAIAAVLAAPDTRITSKQTTVGGSVTAVISPSKREVVISAAGLPRLPGSQVYELWMMGPSRVRPAGLLGPARGGGPQPVLASGLAAGDRLGITVEPAGGTRQPTTSPILVMPVPT